MPHWLRRTAIALALTLGLAASVEAARDRDGDEGVTFTRDVLPILQDNCQVCHRADGANLGGMVAPMSFTTYREARPWAKAMARNVKSRAMPPWHASTDFNGLFVNERSLTDEEIETLVRWAASGAPEGRPADAPPPRHFPDHGGWQIGEPDLVVKMPEPYFIEDDVEDLYVNFTTPLTDEMLPSDRYIKAVEFRAGSPAVHHILSDPLGGLGSGSVPVVYDDGFAQLLSKGSEISFQMHYHKEPGPGTGLWDQSMVALKFYPPGYQPEHRVHQATLGNLTFRIPPGDPNYEAKSEHTFDRDVLLLDYLPHMHLRGKSARYVAYHPDQRQEVLLEIPRYDYNWQTTYKYKEPKRVAAGTRIEVTMAWDNSAANPANPDPTRAVVFGPATTDEMMFGFVSYAYVEESDALAVDVPTLESYVGRYEFPGSDPPEVFNIGVRDDALTIQFVGHAGDAKFVLATEAEGKFSLGVAGIVVRFVQSDQGEVTSLLFSRNHQPEERALKVY